MRVLIHLDNLLLLASSREEVTLQTIKLVTHLSSLHDILEKQLSSALPACHLSGSGTKFSQYESLALSAEIGGADHK